MVAGSSGSHQAADTCRNGNHQHLRDGYVETVFVGNGDEGHHSSCNRRTGDTYLRGDRGHAAGTLGTDTFLQGNVADNGHQRVDHVTGTDEHRQEEGAEGCQESDAVGMLAQQPLSNLDEPVHTARSLHDTGTGYGSDDDVDNVGWRSAGLQSETEDKNGQAYARDGTECQ